VPESRKRTATLFAISSAWTNPEKQVTQIATTKQVNFLIDIFKPPCKLKPAWQQHFEAIRQHFHEGSFGNGW
jgi:hypothetical protein